MVTITLPTWVLYIITGYLIIKAISNIGLIMYSGYLSKKMKQLKRKINGD